MSSSSTVALPWPLLAAMPLTLLLILIILAYLKLWRRPFQIQRLFDAQGIRGPPYRFFVGNVPEMAAMMRDEQSKPLDPSSHNILPRILPYYNCWSNIYGQPFLFWFGSTPRLTVPDPQFVKEILCNKFGHYVKPPVRPAGRQIGGNGIGSLEGLKWAQHRRIVNPLFYMENLKSMNSTMESCAVEMLGKWENLLNSGQKEIDVFKEFRILTADIIARTAFGSSYAEGKRIFEMQTEQMYFVAETFRTLDIPGYRFLPTYKNRRRWKLRREVTKSMRHLVKGRQQSMVAGRTDGSRNDLLGLLLRANTNLKPSDLLTTDDIVDECKTFFFAGHETTSTLLTWSMMLLGQHQEWQERARAEVMEVCGGDKNFPISEIVSQLKIVGMVLYEALRLYPPIVVLTRQTYKPMQLGKLSVPEGTQLFLPIISIHRDQTIWGEDAQQFNPQRFVDGLAKACKTPMAFMPFGMGPRVCVGQNFALLEAKLALSMILRHFTFRLSPAYKHAPATFLTLQPQHGVQIILEQTES